MGLPARAYDRQLPLERQALAAAVQLSDAGPGDRLLDVATGTGGLLRELARGEHWPAEVVGIDRRASALAVAQARLPAPWQPMLGDARRLPFAAESFDIVTVCYLLHLLDPVDRRKVLAGIARVLRPGGRVVTVTLHSRNAASRAALGLLPRSSGLRPLDPVDELAAAGFVPLRARFMTAGWPSLCVLASS